MRVQATLLAVWDSPDPVSVCSIAVMASPAGVNTGTIGLENPRTGRIC